MAPVGHQQRVVPPRSSDEEGVSDDDDKAIETAGVLPSFDLTDPGRVARDSAAIRSQLAEEDYVVVKHVRELNAMEAQNKLLKNALELMETQLAELLDGATSPQKVAQVADQLKLIDAQKVAIAREEQWIQRKLTDIDTLLSSAVRLQQKIDDSTVEPRQLVEAA